MEKLISTYSKLSDSLPRFDKLSAAFKGNPDLQRLTGLIYTDILDFHPETYRFFLQKSWKFFFSTLWGNSDIRFHDILNRLSEHSKLIEIAAQTIDIVEARQAFLKMEREWSKREDESTMSQLQATLRWLDTNDEEQENKLDMLYSRAHDHTCG
ncbi:hypothetical protein BCR34DRAFT_338568 [Clohesyomyces aquaticus]|uniref:DUF7708 domain-containing protein n=1 Tax=Clohesyomyces aquaticus TaxID=1231657 RepID=A0A1Y1ZKZ8_9PLEO|nr:hypothetical protein BCR34DRAFT_338568 [Clohesyomyces aquaticus]